MNLYEKIINIYPSLNIEDFLPIVGTIQLQDNSDGKGAYIAAWTNSNPQPTKQQLDSITG